MRGPSFPYTWLWKTEAAKLFGSWILYTRLSLFALKTPWMPKGTNTVSTATYYGRTTPAPEDTVLSNSFQIVYAGPFIITSLGELQQLSSLGSTSSNVPSRPVIYVTYPLWLLQTVWLIFQISREKPSCAVPLVLQH